MYSVSLSCRRVPAYITYTRLHTYTRVYYNACVPHSTPRCIIFIYIYLAGRTHIVCAASAQETRSSSANKVRLGPVVPSTHVRRPKVTPKVCVYLHIQGHAHIPPDLNNIPVFTRDVRENVCVCVCVCVVASAYGVLVYYV